jgi:hypothetical protein
MVAMWDAIQKVNDARDPAVLQAALQKRELKEYGQRIGRGGCKKRTSSRRLWQRPDTALRNLAPRLGVPGLHAF